MSTALRPGNVVDHDRNIDRVVHRLEMLIEPLLRRLVVIGADHQRRVGTGLFRHPRRVDRMRGRVEAGAGDHRRSALGHLDAELDQALLFLVFERRALAGRADRHQAMRSLANLPGDVFLKRGLVDGAVPERGDQRDKRPLEHGFLPALACGQHHDSPGRR